MTPPNTSALSANTDNVVPGPHHGRRDGQRPSRAEAEAAVRTLIRWAGDDPAREGLLGAARSSQHGREPPKTSPPLSDCVSITHSMDAPSSIAAAAGHAYARSGASAIRTRRRAPATGQSRIWQMAALSLLRCRAFHGGRVARSSAWGMSRRRSGDTASPSAAAVPQVCHPAEDATHGGAGSAGAAFPGGRCRRGGEVPWRRGERMRSIN